MKMKFEANVLAASGMNFQIRMGGRAGGGGLIFGKSNFLRDFTYVSTS